MDLLLKVLSGPLEGQEFALAEGLSLGRQGATISLDDPKVSSLHAQVSEVGRGQWVLRDNASKNGIRDGHGDRLESLALLPGVKFSVGDSLFEVVSAPSPSAPEAAEAAAPPAGDEIKRPAAKKRRQRYWNEVLSEFMAGEVDQFRDRVKPLSPLDPALVLEFVRGVQVNSKWILGFGPRRIGAASLDLPIWEPGAPALCFEILPTHDGLLFKTAHPHLVQLNGEEVDSEVLRMGDTIRILETLIEVDFAE
jgi:hypothetical protein